MGRRQGCCVALIEMRNWRGLLVVGSCREHRFQSSSSRFQINKEGETVEKNV
jgi:hypothetical protein